MCHERICAPSRELVLSARWEDTRIVPDQKYLGSRTHSVNVCL